MGLFSRLRGFFGNAPASGPNPAGAGPSRPAAGRPSDRLYTPGASVFAERIAARSAAAGAMGQPQPRPHAYTFEHGALPARLWAGEQLIGILANPENTDFLPAFWEHVGQHLDPSQRLPADGLRHSTHWLGGEH